MYFGRRHTAKPLLAQPSQRLTEVDFHFLFKELERLRKKNYSNGHYNSSLTVIRATPCAKQPALNCPGATLTLSIVRTRRKEFRRVWDCVLKITQKLNFCGTYHARLAPLLQPGQTLRVKSAGPLEAVTRLVSNRSNEARRPSGNRDRKRCHLVPGRFCPDSALLAVLRKLPFIPWAGTA